MLFLRNSIIAWTGGLTGFQGGVATRVITVQFYRPPCLSPGSGLASWLLDEVPWSGLAEERPYDNRSTK